MSSVSALGVRFVRDAYYPRLSAHPDRLYSLYSEDASWTFADGKNAEESHEGQLAIHTRVVQLSFVGVQVVVESLLAVESLFGSILIQVDGHMTFADTAQRAFAQTFLLQKIEDDDGAAGKVRYLIRNDILHLKVQAEKLPPVAPGVLAAAAPAPALAAAHAQAPAAVPSAAAASAPSASAAPAASPEPAVTPAKAKEDRPHKGADKDKHKEHDKSKDSKAASAAAAPATSSPGNGAAKNESEPLAAAASKPLETKEAPKEFKQKEAKKTSAAAAPRAKPVAPVKPAGPITWANIASNGNAASPAAAAQSSTPGPAATLAPSAAVPKASASVESAFAFADSGNSISNGEFHKVGGKQKGKDKANGAPRAKPAKGQ